MKEELGDRFPDWANIIGDMLRCIADKTHSVQDRIRLGAVCRSWRASLEDQIINFPVCLMLAENQNSDKRCFYNISEETFIDLELPEIREKRCWGSPFGWLVTCGLDLEIQLFNPLSRVILPLPSLCTFTHQDDRPAERLCKYFIHKLLVSSNPCSVDCIVLAIYSQYSLLAFAKPGDERWTPIDSKPSFFDAIYFNGNFFAVNCNSKVFLCEDLYGTHPKAVEFASAPPTDAAHEKYLCDLGGNLCMISRVIDLFDVSHNDEEVVELFEMSQNDEEDVEEEDDEGIFLTVKFEIFKLNMNAKSWEKMFSLDDRSLFLGNCYTFSVVAADYPGCKPNCIYSTDDFISLTNGETGTYDYHNLKNKEEEEDSPIDCFPKSDNLQIVRYSLSLPLWIIPCSQ